MRKFALNSSTVISAFTKSLANAKRGVTGMANIAEKGPDLIGLMRGSKSVQRNMSRAQNIGNIAANSPFYQDIGKSFLTSTFNKAKKDVTNTAIRGLGATINRTAPQGLPATTGI